MLAIVLLIVSCTGFASAWERSTTNYQRWALGEADKPIGNDPPGPDPGVAGRRTILVFVDTPPANAPDGTDIAVDQAMEDWNAALTFHGAPRLIRTAIKTDADIHMVWNPALGPAGETLPYAIDGSPGFGAAQKTVKIEMDPFEDEDINGVNDYLNVGIKNTAMHEFGHALGLGHSAVSSLMHGDGVSPEESNAGGVFIKPGLDDVFGLEFQYNDEVFLRGKLLPNHIEPNFANTTDYTLTVQGETSCGASACSEDIVEVNLEVPDEVVDEGIFAAPPGWLVLVVDAREPPPSSGAMEHSGPRARSLVRFVSTSGTAIPPGGSADFDITTSCDRLGSSIRMFSNSLGNTGGDWSTAFDPRKPCNPRDMVANPGSNEIALTWSAPWSDGGSPVSGYKVYHSTSSTGTYTLLATLGNQLAYTDTTVPPGAFRCYRASAVNAVGEGPQSPEDCATVPTTECSDGVNNDADSWTDFPNDPGCTSLTDNSEDPNPECSDGVNNDADSWTDFPNDPGCTSLTDNSEDPNPSQTVGGFIKEPVAVSGLSSSLLLLLVGAAVLAFSKRREPGCP